MKRLRDYIFVRHRNNWILLLRFGVVGASGVVVNLLVLKLLEVVGPFYDSVWIDLPVTTFNVRWYHVYVTAAFLVANLWNFQLNRGWTFRSGDHAPWLREYVPFLLVGLLSLVVNLVIVTALMHPNSPIALPTDTLDDSTAWRSRLTWANLIAIAVVTPLSFVFNKLWTFRAVRAVGRGA